METIYWAELPLEDDINIPQFNRKKVVTGFNFPGLENEELVEITLKEIYVNKESGDFFMEKKLPNLNVYNEDAFNFKRSIFSNQKTITQALTEIIN